MNEKLIKLKYKLESKGISQKVREAIRSCKICIIDDKIEHLKGMTSALKKEGFNNIIEVERVDSVERLIQENFDLIVLDIGGVALDLSRDDGYGVISRLKEIDPSLPVLVITGSTTPPDKLTLINKADLIRSKPIYPAEFSSDVDLILRISNDKFWAGFELLNELAKINEKIESDISIIDKIRLYLNKRAIYNKILNEDKDVISNIVKIAKITSKLGSVSLKIARIAKGLG
jgi:DNA-binding response OmpR family regulator